MSVGVNGTFIPFKIVPDTMQRFVRPALFSAGHEVWELRTFGTAFLCSKSSVKFPQRIEFALDFGAGAHSFSPGIGSAGAKTLQFRAPTREGLSDRRRA
jgi:hypothetical protein